MLLLVYNMDMAASPKLFLVHLQGVFSTLHMLTHPFQFLKRLRFMCTLGRDLIVISVKLQWQFEMESPLVLRGPSIFVALLILLTVSDICIARQNVSWSGE